MGPSTREKVPSDVKKEYAELRASVVSTHPDAAEVLDRHGAIKVNSKRKVKGSKGGIQAMYKNLEASKQLFPEQAPRFEVMTRSLESRFTDVNKRIGEEVALTDENPPRR